MKPENWQHVKSIFNSALQHDTKDRAEFLDEACAGNDSLRRNIEELLVSYNSDFLESPVFADAGADAVNVNVRLNAGKMVGHYEIISMLGAGGMGEVYLARDRKLDRKVAIKLLNEKFEKHESHLQRFMQEAKAASALNHPNILVIYEIGETEDSHYIVSEFIEGETLRAVLQGKSLPVAQILDISIQIANALTAAHTAHIVHRDIKPENIIIRSDGFAKILDFGLAKLVSHAPVGFEEATLKHNETAQGIIMGTVSYMSPEQAKGEKVDERTDIFSFGVLLYEMITGKTPFAGDSFADGFANLINKDPQPLSLFAAGVPEELQRIVSKMLRKNREERYQTMNDVLADFKDLKENLSFEEKGKRSRPQHDNTTAILQATTQGDPNQQTAETQHGFLQKFKHHKRIAAFAILVALLAGSGVLYQKRNSIQSTSVQDLYLQGRFYSVRENQADNNKAIQLLEQAVALDPNSARVHAELARVYGRRFFYFEPQQKQWEEKSSVELEKAFTLEPDLAEAHEVQGYLLWMPANRFPHEQAIAAYRRALALNPNLDEAHHQLGVIYLHIGLFDEALAELRKAQELNPGNTLTRLHIGSALANQGQFEEALRSLKNSPLDSNPALVGRQTAWVLISLGRREEASEFIAEMLEKYPKDDGGQFTSLKALLSAFAGNLEQAEQEIQDALEKGKGFGHFHHAAYNIACAYAVLNKPEEAVRFLQMAAEDGFPCYPLFVNDANLNSIRENPKFQSFLAAQKRQWEYHKALPQL